MAASLHLLPPRAGSPARVVITGGAGFIGQALARRLLKTWPETQFVLLDSLLPQVHGADPALPEIARHARVQFIQGDIRDPEAVDQALDGCDLLFHLAAETGTGQSMYRARPCFETNVTGTACLIETMVRRPSARPRRVILASSRAVYGEGAYETRDGTRVFPGPRSPENLRAGLFDAGPHGARPLPSHEEDRLAPSSLYGVSKLTQEQMLAAGLGAIGIPCISLRMQNVFGPGQSLHNPYTGLITTFINRLRSGAAIELFEDGLATRDFVFIADVVRAFQAAAMVPGLETQAINVGSGQATDLARLAGLLSDIMQFPHNFTVSGRFRPGDIRHACADPNRMNTRLGPAEATLSVGLARTVLWALKQPHTGDASAAAQAQIDAVFAQTRAAS